MPRVEALLQLSQHSLNDFVDCPRRYYLQYVARQKWPLLESGPGGMPPEAYRAYLQRGVQLHRLIERRLLGLMDAPDLRDAPPELHAWWQRFCDTDLAGLPALRETELALIAPLGDANLYVRYDLLAWNDEEAVIIDWKTLRGERAPSQAWFRDRLQTRVYLYALCMAGSALRGGKPFLPEQVRMRYWLANFPDRPWVELRYSQPEFLADQARLLAMARDVRARNGIDAFPMTPNTKQCTYCTFRTLCARTDASGEPPLDDERVLDEDAPELEY